MNRSLALGISILLHGMVAIALALNIASGTEQIKAPLMVSLVSPVQSKQTSGFQGEKAVEGPVNRLRSEVEIENIPQEQVQDARIIGPVSEEVKDPAKEASPDLWNFHFEPEQEVAQEETVLTVEQVRNAAQPDAEEKVGNKSPELALAVDHNPQSSILNSQSTSVLLAFVGDLSSLGIIMDDALVGDYVRAEAVVFPEPAYPPLSRRRGEEGRVVIKVKVSAEGGVRSAEIVSGSSYTRLDRAALEAVKLVHFSPATKYGRPVDSERTVAYKFELESQ